MKKYIFIKPIDHIQIGHLYEHLYCNQLSNYFRSKGLFCYVDYAISAKTYYAGFIRLEVDLYTDQARQEERIIDGLHISFEEDEISGGLLQIMAEKFATVSSFDDVFATAKMRSYHATPWIQLEDAVSMSFSKKQTTRKGLMLAEQSQRHFGVIRQSISLDPNYASTNEMVTLPLFVVIAKALRLNLQEDVANSSFCFTYDDSFTYTKRHITDTNLYRVDKRQATAITTEQETADRLLRAMRSQGFVERLSQYLLAATLSKDMMCPDEEEIMQKVNILISPKGWHAIGTEESIREVLRHITIQFQLGRSTKSIALKHIFSD